MDQKRKEYNASFNAPLVVEEKDYINPGDFRRGRSDDEDDEEDDTETDLEPSNPTKNYLELSDEERTDKYGDNTKMSLDK